MKNVYFNNEDSNHSDNPEIQDILQARVDFERRKVLKAGAAMMGAASVGMGAFSLNAQAADGVTPAMGKVPSKVTQLTFSPVAKHIKDQLAIPAGYTATVLYALGDPLSADVPDYKNDGSDAQFEMRAGDHHDGMEWFGLDSQNAPSMSAVGNGILGVNHEATTDEKLASHFIHANGGTLTLPRPESEVDKELAIHGVSFVQVNKQNGTWRYLKSSPWNRRITLNSPMVIDGPAAGNALLKTRYATDGRKTRGTLNNCGTGKTPWGTFLTGEENWFGYFHRTKGDDAIRNDKSVVALNRYGRKEGEASRHGWESAGSQDRFARFNNSQTGKSKDGTDDYRNEMNGFGYVVEIDPYNPKAAMVKHTALGRFAHESASFGLPRARQPLSVYMGDDARNEYIYKFVSQELWDPRDANSKDRIKTGQKYLGKGALFAAKFNEDGTGQWLPLSMDNPKIANNAVYDFADLADIVVNARLAADLAGATKMDRPEWNGVHPETGEIYFTLTNNSKRVAQAKDKDPGVDAANPRAYTDKKADKDQKGNVHGHIVRMRDAAHRGASRFEWDIYLFGAEAMADVQSINLSKLNEQQDFSSPDGLWFSPYTGICWIQTDDGAYTDQSNCMMLAALPGSVGDGQRISVNNTLDDGTSAPTQTRIGRQPTEHSLKRFLVGPKDCEITGTCETPDGKTLFVNIQHPGEGTKVTDIGNPASYTSHWPANAGYGQDQRPRSATIVITKDDGGLIGS